MLKIQRILCPVDFSEFSTRAFDYAYSLARHYGAKLTLEHVVQPLTSLYPYYAFPETLNEVYWDLDVNAQEQLRDLVNRRTWNGLKPETVVHRGMLPETILTFAQTQHTDLIVMGTHGRQGIDRMTMGSVTEKVLRKSQCPVLVVRRPAHDFVAPEEKKDPVHLKKILFCSDFSENSRRALSYAISLALEYNTELTILNVVEDVPPYKELQITTAEVARQLEAMVPREASDCCTVKCAVRIGKPYQEIIQLALEWRADLVVMGVRGRNALDVALFGSTTQRVIQLGTCPVLAVRA